MTYETFKKIKDASFDDIAEVEAAIDKISREFNPPPHKIEWRVERDYAILELADHRCSLILREIRAKFILKKGEDSDYLQRQYEKAKAFHSGIKAVLGYGMGSAWPVPDRDC